MLKERVPHTLRHHLVQVLRRGAPGLWLLCATSALLLIGILTLAVRLGPTAAAPASANTSAQEPLAYQGVDLHNATAPGFSLRDQNGAAISLQQFRGRPVALTFFDSVCPHQDCSLMAQYINATADALGKHDAGAAVWLAISMNPWHDTPASATAFLKTRQVQIPLHYLLGTEKTLPPIWSAYHMQAVLQSNGIVLHTSGLFLIDGSGHERTYFAEGFDPKVASQQIHQLLAGSNGTLQPTSATNAANAAFTANATDQGYRIAFTATPGQFGAYDFTVTVEDPSGVPLQGARVAIDLSMPEMEMPALAVSLVPLNPPIPGSYQARGVLSMAGNWQVKVSVTPVASARAVTATFHFATQF